MVTRKEPNPKHIHIVYDNDNAHKATYIASLKGLDASDASLLDGISEVMNKSYHYAFARLQAGDEPNALKRQCLNKFEISGRHYNSNLSKIESRTKATKTARNTKISSLQRKIRRQKTYLKKKRSYLLEFLS